MHASNSILIAVASLVFLSCSKAQQLTHWQNRLETETISYGPDTTYSRAITARNGQLYTGNSNGFIYRLDLKTGARETLNNTALKEIRDIHINGDQVIGMQSADTSRMVSISITKGPSTENSFSVSQRPVFLDGMDILPSGTGFMMGDPTAGYFSLFHTTDHGLNWKQIFPLLKAGDGEAGFAGSGTNVQCLNDSTFVFVSGGMQSRFFRTEDKGNTWTQAVLPYLQSPGSGAFSVHFSDALQGVIVGGDYTHPADASVTSFYTRDGGKTWTASEIPATGYRSCVTAYKGVYYACGTTGIDVSVDGGITWSNVYRGNFIAIATAGKYVYFTIPGGKVERIKAL